MRSITTICLRPETLQEIREQGINISGFVQRCMDELLNPDESLVLRQEQEIKKLHHEIARAKLGNSSEPNPNKRNERFYSSKPDKYFWHHENLCWIEK